LREFDRDVVEFLEALDPSTRRVYQVGLGAFQTFYGNPLRYFLDMVEDDLRKPRRQRTRVARNTLKRFVEWLEERNYAPKTIRAYLSAVQSLARYYEIPMSMRYVRMPASIPVSDKFPWTLKEFATFVDVIKRLDVKSLAVTLFQSGLAVSDVLALTYEDIKREYEQSIVPLCLDLVRIKTDTPHMTFIGSLGFSYLKRCLESRGRLRAEEPLYTLSHRVIDLHFERAAKRLMGSWRGQNPMRPHSLRAAFRTLLGDAGCPETYTEFWMGHSMGDIKKIYVSKRREGWRAEYRKWEPYLTFKVEP